MAVSTADARELQERGKGRNEQGSMSVFGRIDTIGNFVRSTTQAAFFQMGLHAAEAPCVYFGVGCILAIAMIIGTAAGPVQWSDELIDELIMPTGTKAARQVAHAREVFGTEKSSDFLRVSYSTSGGQNILEEPYFTQASDLARKVALEDFRYDGKTYSFQNSCKRYNNNPAEPCMFLCALDLDPNMPINVVTLYTTGRRGFRNSTASMMASAALEEQNVPVAEDAGHFENTPAVRCLYHVKNKDFHKALSWWSEDHRGDILVAVDSEPFRKIEMDRALSGDSASIAIAAVLQLILIVVILIDGCSVKVIHRPLLGLACVFNTALSFGASFGVIGWLPENFDVKLILYSPFIVFIIIGLLMDHMLIFVLHYDGLEGRDLEFPERVAGSMAESANAITLTTLTTAAAFAISLFVDIKLIQNFSATGLVAVLVSMLMQCTVFLALFVLAEKTVFQKNGGNTGPTWTSKKMDLLKKYSEFSAKNSIFKVSVLLFWLIITLIALAGYRDVKASGADAKSFYPTDSPVQDFFKDTDEYFGGAKIWTAKLVMKHDIYPQVDVIGYTREIVDRIKEHAGVKSYQSPGVNWMDAMAIYTGVYSGKDRLNVRYNATRFGEAMTEILDGRFTIDMLKMSQGLLNFSDATELDILTQIDQIGLSNWSARERGTTGHSIHRRFIEALDPIKSKLNATKWIFRNMTVEEASFLAPLMWEYAEYLHNASMELTHGFAAAKLAAASAYWNTESNGTRSENYMTKITEIRQQQELLEAIEQMRIAANISWEFDRFLNKTDDELIENMSALDERLAAKYGSIMPMDQFELGNRFVLYQVRKFSFQQEDQLTTDAYVRRKDGRASANSSNIFAEEMAMDLLIKAKALESDIVNTNRILDIAAIMFEPLSKALDNLVAEWTASSDPMTAHDRHHFDAMVEALHEGAGQMRAEHGLAVLEDHEELSPKWTPGDDGVISLEEVAFRSLRRGLAAGVSGQRSSKSWFAVVNATEHLVTERLLNLTNNEVDWRMLPELTHNNTRKLLMSGFDELAGYTKNLYRRRQAERDEVHDNMDIQDQREAREAKMMDRYWSQDQRHYDEDYGDVAESWILIDYWEKSGAASLKDYGCQIKNDVDQKYMAPRPFNRKDTNRNEMMDTFFARDEFQQDQSIEDKQRSRLQNFRNRQLSEELWNRAQDPFEERQARLDAFDADDSSALAIMTDRDITGMTDSAELMAAAGGFDIYPPSRNRDTRQSGGGGNNEIEYPERTRRDMAQERAEARRSEYDQQIAAEDRWDDYRTREMQDELGNEQSWHSMNWTIARASELAASTSTDRLMALEQVTNLTAQFAELYLGFLGITRSSLDKAERDLNLTIADQTIMNLNRTAELTLIMNGNITNAVIPRRYETLQENRGQAYKVLDAAYGAQFIAMTIKEDILINPAGSRERKNLPTVNYTRITVNLQIDTSDNSETGEIKQDVAAKYLTMYMDQWGSKTPTLQAGTTLYRDISLGHFWQVSDVFGYSTYLTWYDVKQQFPGEALFCLGWTLLIIFILCTLFKRITSSILVTFCVFMLNITIVGFLAQTEIGFDTNALAALLLTVGYLVDYMVHMVNAFVAAGGADPTKVEAVHVYSYSLQRAGLSILQSYLVTLIGMIPMAFSATQTVFRFWAVFMLSSIMAVLYGIFFIPLFMLSVWPKETLADLEGVDLDEALPPDVQICPAAKLAKQSRKNRKGDAPPAEEGEANRGGQVGV